MKAITLTGLLAIAAAYQQTGLTHPKPHKKGPKKCEIKYEFHCGKGGMKDWWGWRCIYDGAVGINYHDKAEAEQQAAIHVLERLD